MMNTRAVTSQLTMRIVRALRRGPKRFNEIDRAVDAPNAPVLSKHLKKMVRDGLIVRHVHRLGPPAIVSYELTALGVDFARHAMPLMDWLDAHTAEIQAARDFQIALAARAES
jgi:DNA-binding HxlR family transcriptional regulator